MGDLKTRYIDFEAVVSYLEAMQADVVDNVDIFRPIPGAGAGERHRSRRDSACQTIASIRSIATRSMSSSTIPPGTRRRFEYADLPSYGNLFGRAEHHAQLGALVTDFTLIKSGALHRANGGYLILDAGACSANPTPGKASNGPWKRVRSGWSRWSECSGSWAPPLWNPNRFRCR